MQLVHQARADLISTHVPVLIHYNPAIIIPNGHHLHFRQLIPRLEMLIEGFRYFIKDTVGDAVVAYYSDEALTVGGERDPLGVPELRFTACLSGGGVAESEDAAFHGIVPWFLP